MPRPDSSDLYDLTESRLGEDPAGWLRARHDAGKSWELIAAELWEATGKLRWINSETLRQWARP